MAYPGGPAGPAPWERAPAPGAPGFDPDPAEGEWREEWDDGFDEPPRITFSSREILHLAMSVGVLSVAFSFAILGTGLLFGGAFDLAKLFEILPWSFVIVTTGFVLHELAHKVAAQLKHMWAEFQASPTGLAFGLVISGLTGIVIAAPGAVVIYGHASTRDTGVISIVGPLTNIAIAIFAIPFHFGRVLDFTVGDYYFWQILMLVNTALAAFNMLPIRPLDGSKVWAWSKIAYVATILVILGLFVLAFTGTGAISSSCLGTEC